MSSGSDALAGAKATLAEANKKFPSPAAPAPVKHEYADTPYSMVKNYAKRAVEKIKEATGNKPPTGEDIAAGLKARREMQEK